MHQAVREDRRWFENHPCAIVRFRRAMEGEFTPLTSIGEKAPIFRPTVCRPCAPLLWVAVVDLMRLVGSRPIARDGPTARLRLRIPAIRSAHRRKIVEKELLTAIAEELLETTGHGTPTKVA